MIATSTTPPVSAATYSRIGFRVAGIPAPKGSARAIKRGDRAVLIASSSNANRDAQRAWATAVGWAAKAVHRAAPWTGQAIQPGTPAVPTPDANAVAPPTSNPPAAATRALNAGFRVSLSKAAAPAWCALQRVRRS